MSTKTFKLALLFFRQNNIWFFVQCSQLNRRGFYISVNGCHYNNIIQSKVNGTNGAVAEDHRNYSDYRLYSLVVTYTEPMNNGVDSKTIDDLKKEKIDASAYIRYYDANGKERIFYNDYKKNSYYGGCLCSFNQALSQLTLPKPDKPFVPKSNEDND